MTTEDDPRESLDPLAHALYEALGAEDLGYYGYNGHDEWVVDGSVSMGDMADYLRTRFRFTPVNRPHAKDMPVGTVVAYADQVLVRRWKTPDSHAGWCRIGEEESDIQSGWVEGLFTDDLATVLRLGKQ